MIQRQHRVLYAVAALSALVACKSDKAGSGWNTAGSGSGRIEIPVGSGSAVIDSGSATPQPGDAITRPFLYRVEKDGKTSHLMGTWHVGIHAEKQLPKSVWDTLDTAKTFALETDPTDPAGLSAFMRNDGRTLEDDLGPEYWAKLEALLGAQRLASLQRMKPFAAAAIIQLKDMPDTPSMDLSLAGKARDGKKEIRFLEPALVQVKALERWFDLRMLRTTIDDYATTRQKIDEAMVAYLAGDEAALTAGMFDRETMKEAGFTETELDQAMEQFLYDRNAAWIPAIEDMHAKGDAFIAVGAGHLIGPKSVVELLQAKGYTVTRVGA